MIFMLKSSQLGVVLLPSSLKRFSNNPKPKSDDYKPQIKNIYRLTYLPCSQCVECMAMEIYMSGYIVIFVTIDCVWLFIFPCSNLYVKILLVCVLPL